MAAKRGIQYDRIDKVRMEKINTMAENQETTSEKCPCHGNTLERLVRPAVLIILAQGDQYGYRIVQQLTDMPIFGGQKPNSAGVYRCLKLMEEEGRLTSSWERSDRGIGKRQYTMTLDGERCLATWLETLASYHRAIADLLSLGRDVVKKKNGSPPKKSCCNDRQCETGRPDLVV